MQSTIYFYGGAGTVTGSNFLLDAGAAKFLIDCGLEQGSAEAFKRNEAPFAYDPKGIAFLIVTHAHLDHVGRVPLLVKHGFKGRILSTEPTRAIAEALLHDELEIMRHNAAHHGAQLLYDEGDITAALALWQTTGYHAPQQLEDGVSLEFLDSGHILGSAMAKLNRGGRSIVFTGDLGGGNSPFLPLCEEPAGANYLVMESVYGDRVREDSGRREKLEDVIENSAARGGALLIPAFSTERTQDLLYEIRTLMLEKRVPSMPVYVDSPLAQKVTETYLDYPQYFSPALQAKIKNGEHIFSFPELQFVKDAEASHALAAQSGPRIILAGSGMGQGGRVLGHEKELLPRKDTTLLIVGYQAAGTTGRQLIEGVKKIRIWKDEVAVKAHIEQIYGYSAHMDAQQLVEFVNKIHTSLAEVFVVMGEPLASATLTQRLRDYLGVNARAPEAGDKQVIDF